MGYFTLTPYTLHISIEVNGQSHDLEVDTRWTLLHVLREELGLTGAKRGCDRGECGACTVLLDGMPVNACMTLSGTISGSSIRTVEGLSSADTLHPLQQAFLENDGAQCGFCTPGFLMSAKALLENNPSPTDEEVRSALAGNICRCNAYGRIIESVRAARSAR
jgi:carbon-monoxide dehydrogenase small subunit